MTKAVSYKQNNRLTQGVFHKCPILCVLLLGVLRTFGQDCSFQFQFLLVSIDKPYPILSWSAAIDLLIEYLVAYWLEHHISNLKVS